MLGVAAVLQLRVGCIPLRCLRDGTRDGPRCHAGQIRRHSPSKFSVRSGAVYSQFC